MRTSPARVWQGVCLLAVGTTLGCGAATQDPSVGATAGAPVETRAARAPGSEPATAQPAGGPVRMTAQASRDLFAGKSWRVAPPPLPPPKPVAPPFPYVFAGSMRDESDPGKVVLFIARGDRPFVVRKGDALGNTYRLDDITEGEAVFTYLPLQQQQRLPIGNAR